MDMKKSQKSVLVPDSIERDPSTMVPDEIREVIKAAVGNFRAAMLRCSRLLFRVREEKLFTLWGYCSFGVYVGEELGLEVKHAESLVRIEREVVERGGVSREDVQLMGVAKALALSPLATKGLLTEDNREEIISVAKSSSVRHLKSFVASVSSKTACGPRAASVRLVFTLSSEQAAIIHRALGLAQEVVGGASPSALLAAICENYLCVVTSDGVETTTPSVHGQVPGTALLEGKGKGTRSRRRGAQQKPISSSSQDASVRSEHQSHVPSVQIEPIADQSTEPGSSETDTTRRASTAKVRVRKRPIKVPLVTT